MHERALSEVESLGGGFGCRLSLFDILKKQHDLSVAFIQMGQNI